MEKSVNDLKREVQDLLQNLETAESWYANEPLSLYNGVWLHHKFFPSIIFFRNRFKTEASHVIIATLPKSGTTWLKALTFSIVNRLSWPSSDDSPLHTANPHTLVPFIDIDFYKNVDDIKVGSSPHPKVLATHLPYKLLPDTVVESDSRIIYICRNPLDHFVSIWHFLDNQDQSGEAMLNLEESFEMYCRGVHGFGPFWEHMEGYWNAHLKNPKKVLFLMYEDLKADVLLQVKKIAEFVGCPFSLEEEEGGAVERIAELCSFNSLKNMEVNKKGCIVGGYKNSSLFRKGEVGDHVNHLTPAMVDQIRKLMDLRLKGSGLVSKFRL